MTSKFTISALLYLFLAVNFMNAQECPPAESLGNLNGNNVNAGVTSSASMFWNFSDATYEVPAGSGKHAIFSASPWMGGIDALGQLKVSANTYRQSGSDYFSGPIDADGNAVCGFDRVFTISKAEVIEFVGSGFTKLTENIANWPGKNNQQLIEEGFDMNYDLAPFYDADEDGNYTPENGDYPLIKGDNNVWRVFNDIGGSHTESGGVPIGMEIKSSGYSFNTNDYLNNTTFWDFELNYKGATVLNDYYFGFWIDADLGDFEDDLVGCNPEKNTAYVYNGDNFDGGTNGYGDEIPALAVTFINGLKDADNTDLGMSSFTYYNNDFEVNGNPETAIHFYNYLSSKWKDDSDITEGGDGYGGTTPTKFMFSGSPNDPNGWSECSESTQASDRRFLMVTGPINLQPNTKQTVTLGINWGEPENFEYPCPDIHSWVDTYKDDMVGFINNIETEITTSSAAIPLSINQLNVSPNPTSGLLNIEVNESADLNKVVVFGIDGKQLAEFSLANKESQNINLSGFNNGIYFIKIYNKLNEVVATERVIIAK